MTDKAISPLRQRMIEDMTIRKFAQKTQHDYLQRVKNFTAYLGRSPDTASSEDLRRYQLHLMARGGGVPTLNQTVSTLRFFFKVTLGRPDLVERTAFVHEPRKLPVVLSPEEVARLLDAAPSLKYKAALSVAYGAGLRVSEVVALKIGDIDSKRMVIRVEQGKGRKDRYVMLSPHLLELLRAWWRAARPQGWLFPGRDRVQPMTTRQLNRACHTGECPSRVDRYRIAPLGPFPVVLEQRTSPDRPGWSGRFRSLAGPHNQTARSGNLCRRPNSGPRPGRDCRANPRGWCSRNERRCR